MTNPIRFAAVLSAAAALTTAILLPDDAAAQAAGQITVPRPGQREFIADRADLIAPADEEKIRTLCDSLLTDKATPIIVVTIESMAQYGGEAMRIETFAMLLFNEWGIGHAELKGQSWNTGILLLVSKADRKARIELGAYWRHEQDVLAQQIMNEQLIPRFKRGDFSGGIVAGVESLDRMARGLTVPGPQRSSGRAVRTSDVPTPWWQYGLVVVVVIGAVLAAISFARNGSNGWAWIGGAALLGGLGYLLYHLHENASRDNDDWGGGGFTGGSFGGSFSGGGGFSGGSGGFSGGGGATGSW